MHIAVQRELYIVVSQVFQERNVMHLVVRRGNRMVPHGDSQYWPVWPHLTRGCRVVRLLLRLPHRTRDSLWMNARTRSMKFVDLPA
jgi:hypothetical protein